MRHSVLFISIGVLAGCQGDAKKKTGNADVIDAGTDGGTEDPSDIVAKRKEVFPCNTADAPTAMDAVLFTGSSVDELGIREDGMCQHTIVHKRTDTGVETPLFTGAFSFGEAALRDVDGTLVVCASQVKLSPPTSWSGEITDHLIENVSVKCTSSTGGAWSTAVVVAGPAAGNDWAAWTTSLEPTGPGQYQLKWIRDFTLFPFSFVDAGRPAEDGIYLTEIGVSSSGISVGATTKISDSVMDDDEESTMYTLPNGQKIPYGKSTEFALPPTALPLQVQP